MKTIKLDVEKIKHCIDGYKDEHDKFPYLIMSNKTIRLTAIMLLGFSLSAVAQSLTDRVNPFIGTGGHGHVFLGANVPFGLVQLGPTQYTHGWDWCSGYHYSDSVLVGFGHLHLSGTGVGDLGDVSLLPLTHPTQKEVKFSHRAERVRPGYYAVTLDNGVHVELTATERAGMHRYTWPADVKRGYLRIDLKRGIGWDRVTSSKTVQESGSLITGHRFSKGWADNQQVYFAAEFSRPVEVNS